MAKSGLVLYGALVVLCSCFVLTRCAPESALITQLPGFDGSFTSKHYSGYASWFSITLKGRCFTSFIKALCL